MDPPDIKNIIQDCKGYTLIMPAISVSNAGQLAVDLLIQSTNATKKGNIWHEAFIPYIGSHPYNSDSDDLCTEFEVYELKHHKILLCQFRSPLWQNKEEDFLNLLVKWIEELQVSKVLILASLYDHERSDRQIKDPQVRCCMCPLTYPLYASTLRKLNCKFMECKGANEEAFGLMSKALFLPGAGFTQELHLKCADKEIPCVSFLKFCSDGDNTPEALELARVVDDWLNIVPSSEDKKQFIQPPSWRYIFGGPPPPELFP